jgi:hypothetical protein
MGYDWLADAAANATIPRASRGHLGAGRASAGVANVEPRNEGPGNLLLLLAAETEALLDALDRAVRNATSDALRHFSRLVSDLGS